jgi:hypothetical protein
MQKIAFSQCANKMLISVIQNDAQDGGDHVDRRCVYRRAVCGAKCVWMG